MSTWWYMQCADHDPPLRSHDEFTQHTDDAYYRNGIALAMARPLAPEQESIYRSIVSLGDSSQVSYFISYFGLNLVPFLREHPKCRLVLVNEYGEERDLEEERSRRFPAALVRFILLRHHDSLP